jgi:hypothetical protein
MPAFEGSRYRRLHGGGAGDQLASYTKQDGLLLHCRLLHNPDLNMLEAGCISPP